MTPRPLFEHPGATRSARRLLLISYHFPPDTTIGARRWEKLSHFVAERGWGLDVITCAEPGADLSRLELLPEDTRVYALPPQYMHAAEWLEHQAWRAYRTIRPAPRAPAAAGKGMAAADAVARGAGPRGDAARGTAAPLPDIAPREHPDTVSRHDIRWWPLTPRKMLRSYWVWLDFVRHERWARDAVRLAEQILEPGVHFAVVTSGPPHMTHETGRILSERHGLPFVMDMRDPWSLNERVTERWASPLWLRGTARHEREMVRQAALVVANTAPARDALARAYPDASERIITVMNGSDDDPLPPQRRGGRFTIAYAGTVYDYGDPRSLFRAAARVIRDLALTPADFGMDFIGNFDDGGEQALFETARTEGVEEFISVGPTRSHEGAMHFLSQATMLVTFPGWNSVAIPGKVFECVRFDAWLLALSDAGSATDLLLRGTDADVVPRDDIEGIARVIERRYQAHRRGEEATHIARDERFSRRLQARILLDALARLAPASEIQPPRDRDARTPRTSYSR
jgi:glycosyltransferase involved in cell wall biosynthesis